MLCQPASQPGRMGSRLGNIKVTCMAKRTSVSPSTTSVAGGMSHYLATLTPGIRIAHQIGGRVRLKLDGSVNMTVPGDTVDLGQILKVLPGVRDIHINLLARSCVIEYDSTVISDAAWPDLLAGRATQAALSLQALFEGAFSRLSPASAEQGMGADASGTPLSSD